MMRRLGCVLGCILGLVVAILGSIGVWRQIRPEIFYRIGLCPDIFLLPCPGGKRENVGDPSTMSRQFAEVLAFGKVIPPRGPYSRESQAFWEGRIRLEATVHLTRPVMPRPVVAGERLYSVFFFWLPVSCVLSGSQDYYLSIVTEASASRSRANTKPYVDLLWAPANAGSPGRLYWDRCELNRRKTLPLDYPVVYSSHWLRFGPAFHPMGNLEPTIPPADVWVWLGMVRDAGDNTRTILGFSIEPAPAVCTYYLPPASEGRVALSAGWLPDRFPRKGARCIVYYSDGTSTTLNLRRGVKRQGEFTITWELKPKWLKSEMRGEE